jgi:hypothetical protein
VDEVVGIVGVVDCVGIVESVAGHSLLTINNKMGILRITKSLGQRTWNALLTVD